MDNPIEPSQWGPLAGMATLVGWYLLGLNRGWHVLGKTHRKMEREKNAQIAKLEKELASSRKEVTTVRDAVEKKLSQANTALLDALKEFQKK